MKDKSKRRTILGIILLVVVILALVVIFRGNTPLKIGAKVGSKTPPVVAQNIKDAINQATGQVVAAGKTAKAQQQAALEACTAAGSIELPASSSLSSQAAKDNAIEQIKKCHDPLINELSAKYKEVQANRLSWYGWGLLVVLPLVGFTGFMLFPRLMRDSIRSRLPGVSLARFYKLYFVQGLVAALMLLVLGFCLWFCQFWLSNIGAGTNPQLVLQKEEISYVATHSTRLVTRYPEVYVPVAQEMTKAPDASLLALVIESGLKERYDGLLDFQADLINFTWPTFSAMFFVTFAFLLILFLHRIWPELKNMLRYPVEKVAAEQAGDNLTLSTWAAARRLMLIELRVILTFGAMALGLIFLTSLILQQFFQRIIELLIEIISGGMIYFVRLGGESSIVAWATFVLLVFVVEAVILFMLAFALLVSKVTGTLRDRYQGKYEKKESRRLLRQHFKAFLWIAIVAVGLSIGLSLLASWFISLMTEAEKPQWVPILLGTPLIILAGLNGGMWLLGGFRAFRKLMPDNIVGIPLGQLARPTPPLAVGRGSNLTLAPAESLILPSGPPPLDYAPERK
jgi:hypothetical protein